MAIRVKNIKEFTNEDIIFYATKFTGEALYLDEWTTPAIAKLYERYTEIINKKKH